MIFKTVDSQLNDLGFLSGGETEAGFVLLRAHGKFGGVHKVIFENDVLLSYDSTIPDYKGQGFKAVGLTETEMILILKKIKQWRKTHEHNK